MLVAIRTAFQHRPRAGHRDGQDRALPGLHTHHGVPQGTVLQSHGLLSWKAAQAV